MSPQHPLRGRVDAVQEELQRPLEDLEFNALHFGLGGDDVCRNSVVELSFRQLSENK